MSKNIAIPFRFLLDPVHFLALGLGSGMPRFAPGTWGTLMALILFLLAHRVFGAVHWSWLSLVVIAGALSGIYLCGKTARDLGVHDHGAIVWDEFIGFWLCLIGIPVGWYWLLAAFVLFRIFDILKPLPIKWADQKVHGGLGVMLDDLIAGAYVLAILHAAKWALGV
ncbi:MAG: phosphatidylglycerophosphatase A [Pseudomonadales bacterium]